MKGKGLVGIEEYRGKYRLRLPRSADISTRYINTGLDINHVNRIKLQELATRIDRDSLAGTLDRSLVSYRVAATEEVLPAKETAELPVSTNTYRIPAVSKAPPAPNKEKVLPSILELWGKFCQYRKPQVAVTTYHSEYGKYGRHLEALPSHDLADAVQIRDWLLDTKTTGQAKRVLTYLNACCRWAVESGILPDNPFQDMPNSIRYRKSRYDIDPFTYQERDAIVHAFEAHHRHAHYLPYVKLLFLTGARPGELAALRWQDVARDFSTITFRASYCSQQRVFKDTKTGVVRRFPCNEAVRTVLHGQRNLSPTHNISSLVLTGSRGKPIHTSNFCTKVWGGHLDRGKYYPGLVNRLVETGQVARYRCPYNCRHTYITMAVEAGVPVTQVAKWVGNSAEVILRHYAGTLASMASPVV